MAYEKLKDENYQNFGGINVKVSDYVTGPNEVLDLRNFTFVRPGKWTSRPGVEVSYSLARSTFSLAPRSNIQYTKDDGSSYQLFDSGQTLYLRGTNAAISGSLAVGATSPLLDYVVQNNYLYITNGFAFKRYDGSNSLNWNVESSFSGVAQFLWPQLISAGGNGVTSGITFNISLTPVNGATVVISLQDARFISFGGYRNTASLQTVAVKYNTFQGDTVGITTGAIYPDYRMSVLALRGNGFSLPGAPTFVGFGRWVVWGFSMKPELGISSLIMQSGATAGLTAVPGTSLAQNYLYFNDVRYSLPVPFAQAASYGFGASNTEVVVFDHFTDTQEYRFQEYLNLRPKYLQTYNNMLFMANIVGQSIAPSIIDQPSTVYYSNLAEPEQVDPENFLEIRTGNGDVITGMCNYQTSLLIFKQYSVHQVSGSSPETLSVSDLSLEYGLINNRAVIAFENLCWFVDPNGIIEYNGSSFTDISTDRIRAYLDQVDKTNISAVHVKKNNQVIFSASQKSFTYDYIARAWTIFDNLNIDQNAGPAYMTYGASVRDLTYWQTGASFHQSVRFNDQLTTDFGLPITLAIKTRFHKRLGESTQELWRRFFLNTTSSGTSMSAVTLNFYPDYGSSIYLQRNFTISSFQQRIDFGISAKSLSIEILLQSAQAVSINGYTVESRYLRSV